MSSLSFWINLEHRQSIMATEDTVVPESPPPVLLVEWQDALDFISAPTHRLLKRVLIENDFMTTTFNGRTYVVQDTGQVDIYDTATQLLQETIEAQGLPKLSSLMIFPSRIYSMQAGYFLSFEDKRWAKMEHQETADRLGCANSCFINGDTYVVMTMKVDNSNSGCGNCIGTYSYRANLYKLHGTDLDGVGVNISYIRSVPFVLPYPPSRIILIGGDHIYPPNPIYEYHVKSKKKRLIELGSIATHEMVTSACISGDRLYALYAQGSYLDVSLKTGMGRFVSFKLMHFLWVVSKKMRKLTPNILKEIVKEFMQLKHLAF